MAAHVPGVGEPVSLTLPGSFPPTFPFVITIDGEQVLVVGGPRPVIAGTSSTREVIAMAKREGTGPSSQKATLSFTFNGTPQTIEFILEEVDFRNEIAPEELGGTALGVTVTGVQYLRVYGRRLIE
jgi:hypothetical protein